MSNKPLPGEVLVPALGKGCLVGLGMVIGFFAISLLAYLLLGLPGLPENIRLLVSVASGPVLGTVIALLIAYRIARRAREGAAESDETAPWDSA